ncbi:hypothetical protein Tco_0882049 [Tanacetum coccineum]
MGLGLTSLVRFQILLYELSNDIMEVTDTFHVPHSFDPLASVELLTPVEGDIELLVERISKKRTKNEAKTTKPDTEWKSMVKTKSRQSPSLKKSTKVNPDKSKSQT